MIGFSEAKAREILEEVLEKADNVCNQVEAILPKNFPLNISQPILEGMVALAKRSLNNRSQWN